MFKEFNNHMNLLKEGDAEKTKTKFIHFEKCKGDCIDCGVNFFTNGNKDFGYLTKEANLNDLKTDHDERIIFQYPSNSAQVNLIMNESISNIINFQTDIIENNKSTALTNLTNRSERFVGNPELSSELFREQEIVTHRRKWSKDSIHKKIKRFFLKFLQSKFSLIFKKKAPKIPQKTVSDVSIRFNKEMLIYNVYDFYKKFCSIDIKSGCGLKKENNKVAEEFLNSSLMVVYYKYLEEQFDSDLKVIRSIESRFYCEKLKEESRMFVDYFMKLQPFQKKKF